MEPAILSVSFSISRLTSSQSVKILSFEWNLNINQLITSWPGKPWCGETPPIHPCQWFPFLRICGPSSNIFKTISQGNIKSPAPALTLSSLGVYTSWRIRGLRVTMPVPLGKILLPTRLSITELEYNILSSYYFSHFNINIYLLPELWEPTMTIWGSCMASAPTVLKTSCSLLITGISDSITADEFTDV